MPIRRVDVDREDMNESVRTAPKSGPHLQNVSPVATAVGFALAYGALRLYWAAGGRWGYTACSQRHSHTPTEVATGCSANAVKSLPLLQGWPAVMLCCVLVALGLGTIINSGRAVRTALWTACASLVCLAFPAHLLFELPAAAFGYTTDWRNVINRIILLIGGFMFAQLALSLAPTRAGETPRIDQVRPVPPRLRRWTYAAAIIPIVGFTVPHLFWTFGIPLGIPSDMLDDASNSMSLAEGLTLSLAPTIGTALTIGLICRWGQVLPAWVPLIGKRGVPPIAALIPGATIALALTCYGIIGLVIMAHSFATGESPWADFVEGWAVNLTEVVFLVWGVALGGAIREYHVMRSNRP
jgi:hypothetical protein